MVTRIRIIPAIMILAYTLAKWRRLSAELVQAGVGSAGKDSGEGFHVEEHTDLESYPKGIQHKTVKIAIGASLKGMGASGLTVEEEVDRFKKIVALCQVKGIFIIGFHVGGNSKRGTPGGDNKKMIDAVLPFADYLIVTSEGNKDGRFTKISEEKGIPLTEIEHALEVATVLPTVFE